MTETLKLGNNECRVKWRTAQVAVVVSPLGNLAVACLDEDDNTWHGVWYETEMEEAMKKVKSVMMARNIGMA